MDIQELIEAVPIDEYIGQFVDWDHEENGSYGVCLRSQMKNRVVFS